MKTSSGSRTLAGREMASSNYTEKSRVRWGPRDPMSHYLISTGKNIAHAHIHMRIHTHMNTHTHTHTLSHTHRDIHTRSYTTQHTHTFREDKSYGLDVVWVQTTSNRLPSKKRKGASLTPQGVVRTHPRLTNAPTAAAAITTPTSTVTTTTVTPTSVISLLQIWLSSRITARRSTWIQTTSKREQIDLCLGSQRPTWNPTTIPRDPLISPWQLLQLEHVIVPQMFPGPGRSVRKIRLTFAGPGTLCLAFTCPWKLWLTFACPWKLWLTFVGPWKLCLSFGKLWEVKYERISSHVIWSYVFFCVVRKIRLTFAGPGTLCLAFN